MFCSVSLVAWVREGLRTLIIETVMGPDLLISAQYKLFIYLIFLTVFIS